MSFSSEFNGLLKKRLQEQAASKGTQPKSNDIAPVFNAPVFGALNTPGTYDIAPLSYQIYDRMTVGDKKKDKEDNLAFFQKGLFEDGYDFGDLAKTILGVGTEEKGVHEYWDSVPGLTLGELKVKMDTEKDIGKQTEYTKYFNDKMLAEYAKVFADTTMDGQGHSVLDEIDILSKMESGKEKDERKTAVLTKMEELGMPKEYYALFAGDGEFDFKTFSKFIGSAAAAGLNSFNKGLADTADLLLGAPLREMGWENNPFTKLADYYNDNYKAYAYNRDLYAKQLGGGAWDFAGSAVEGTVGAVPHALLAFMTGGTSLGASKMSAGSELATKAALETGNVLTKAGLTAETMLKNPQFWTSFASTLGTDYQEAKAKGASDKVAAIGSVLSSMLNAGIEIGIDGGSGVQGLPSDLADGGSKFWSWFESTAEEAGEEDLQKFVNEAFGKFLYRSDEEILNPIDYAREGTLGFIAGGALGGGQVLANSAANALANQNAKNPTQNEMAVIEKLVADEIAKRESEGKKVSSREKSNIEADIVRDMEKGRVSIETIEEVLGGEAYDKYKAAIENQKDNDFLASYEELRKKTNPTTEDVVSLMKMEPTHKSITDYRNQTKAELSSKVAELVKSDRLNESYNEKTRRSQKFEADLSQYDEKQRVTVQKAMDSGIINNTNKSHDFVNLIAKISADKDIVFNFANNEKLKESGFSIEGKEVNGFVTKDGVSLNIDSRKALNTTVGYEITHVMEGTELYTEMQKAVFAYAESKGELGSRWSKLKELYKGIDGADVNAELTADLVGDYLFSDDGFVRNLSTGNRNVFQKIYDEIKYLCKAATAGSKEARELERIKHLFEEAHRAEGKSQTGTKYSMSEDGHPVTKDMDGEVMYSLSNDTDYMDKAISQNESMKRVDSDVIGSDIGIAPIAPRTEFDAPVAETAAPVAETVDVTPKAEMGGQQSETSTVTASTRKELHLNLVDGVRTAFSAKGFDFDKVLKNAKNLRTWSTVDNTPQRVMEKALGYKEGQILADMTVNKAAQNETEGIKWLNGTVDMLKSISKQYGIKPGSKESAAAQMYAEGFYVNENNEIVAYGDRELAIDFPDAKARANIKGLAGDSRIRQFYDDTLKAINESRRRNLYPEIQRLDNYFLHFRAMEDTFSRLGLPFNPNDIRAKDLPTDLNGVTADLKPGQPYFASAMHRMGKRTSFDLLGGLERYANSAKNQIYHIDDIQILRALRNHIADTYGQAHGLEGLDDLTEIEQQERIQEVFGSHLSTFAKFLNEEANVLAGKTALIDRGAEGMFGRRAMTFLNTLNGQVGSNMVGYNISSSLTNFLPVAQTFAKTNKFDFTKAFVQTAINKLSGGKLDTFTEDSPVVIRRKGSERFHKTMWQKMADPGYALMSAVDDVSTEIIARTKFNEFTRKGMDAQTAHFETDKWVSRLMGDRSIGQMPQIYNSKTLGLFTKFQLEVRNQLDSQFYDTIQETKVSNEHMESELARNAKTAAQITSTLVQLAVAQHLYGKAFESVAGYNPAFDIIEVLMTAFGYDDDEESEDTALDNLGQGLLALAEDLPYLSTFTGGGRIPMSSALPNIGAILAGEDEYGNEIGVPQAAWDNIKEIAPYYALPAGWGQIKKTAAGLEMYDLSEDHPIAGSYTASGNLRYPVNDAPLDVAQAAIFGQYANENARKYFDEERRTLNKEQTKIFAELGMPIEDYWEYQDNYNQFKDLRNELYKAASAEGAAVEDAVRSEFADSIYYELNDLYKQQKELAESDSLLKQSQMRDIQQQMSDLLERSKMVDRVKVDGIYAEVGDRRYNYSEEKDTWYEIKPKNSEGDDNWYYTQEQLFHDKLGVSYADYWNGNFDPAVDSVKTHYAEMNGKRYNFDTDKNQWYEIQEKNEDGSDNWYYTQEQLFHDELGVSYADYWGGNFDPAVDSVKSYYAERDGKRYNYDAEKNRWYEIREKNEDGSDNWYYQMEQEATRKFGISKEEYWSKRDEYNFGISHPQEYALAGAVGGYDKYKEYYDALESWNSDSYIGADKDKYGKSISGSRKKKVKEYVYGLDLPEVEKHILFKSVYTSDDSHNREIVEYLNNRRDLSYKEKELILVKLGAKVDSKGKIKW